LFAVYCTLILFRVNLFCGSVGLILAALVFWSRLFLSRHTMFENASGVLLGALGGIATAWMST
jgi:predicted membrane protein